MSFAIIAVTILGLSLIGWTPEKLRFWAVMVPFVVVIAGVPSYG